MNINYENYIVHITVQQKDIDLKHPLNSFGNSKSSGTGFYIDKGLILTCYHVIQNSLEIMVSTKNKSNNTVKIKANVKYIFPDDDLAVIELESQDIIYNVFEYHIITTSEINKDVNTIGYPLNSTSLKINKGVISGFQDSNIQTDSTLNHGNSGGPLILNNKVIGINQSKMSGEATNTGYAIPIFRFLILFKLKKDKLKLINYKPKFLFKYQKNQQNFNNFDYGVRVSKINNLSILKKSGIFVDDLILEINKNKIDSLGSIKFDFFPGKIMLNDLGLWFTENDELLFTIYSNKEKQIKNIKIIAKYIQNNLINYHTESNIQYNFEKKGLVFSIVTDYHIKLLKEIEVSLMFKVNILSRSLDDKFTVYLSDLIYDKLKFTDYPINEIITHINEIEISSYSTLIEVMKTEIKNFRTINNDFFLI
jgi:hypothetical protein